MPVLPRLLAESLLSTSLRTSVNPAAVELYGDPPRTVGLRLGKRLRRSLIAAGLPTTLAARLQHLCIGLSRFSPPAERWPEPGLITADPKYIALADLAAVWPDYRRSGLYRNLHQTLQREQLARYYQRAIFHTAADLDHFFTTRLGALIESLIHEGYRQRRRDDIGTAWISADGSLVKSDKGDHRFFLCRSLQIPSVPLRLIAIHPAWLASRQLSLGLCHRAALQTALADLLRHYR